MSTKLFTITLLLLCLSSSAFAIAPIGPPKADIKTGWWFDGFDYSKSKTDLKIKNALLFDVLSNGTLKDFNVDLFLGKLGHGINDNWTIFAGLGVAKADIFSKQIARSGDNYLTKYYDMDGDLALATQLGTKATFYRTGPFEIGALFQVTWLSLDGTMEETNYIKTEYWDTGKADLETDIMLTQFAPGVSYAINDYSSFYGGPLFQWIDGDSKAKGKSGLFSTASDNADIEEERSFGCWFGLQVEIEEETTCNIEYQSIGSSNTIGFNLSTRF